MKRKGFDKFYDSLFTILTKKDVEECENINSDRRTIRRYANCCKNSEDAVENFAKMLNYMELNPALSVKRMYDPIYTALKHNVSLEEGHDLVAQLKSNKATSKIKFIKRHGQEEGLKKFKEFQQTSKLSSDRIAAQAQGDESRTLFYRDNSIRCPEYYIKRALAKDWNHAKTLADKFQRENSGVNLDFYILRGYPEEIAHKILQDINAAKASGYQKMTELFGEDEARIKMTERTKKLRTTLGCVDKAGYQEYKAEVDKHTKLSVLVYRDKIPNIEKRSREWHLDHKFSKMAGFRLGIEPRIIGHWANLEVINASLNCSKQDACTVDIETLMEVIIEMENI